MRPAVCWLRRNLRLDDNAALDAALRAGGEVVPVFVLDDYYLREDFSKPRLAFLAASLRDLEGALAARGSRLVVRKGPAGPALKALAAETGAREVFTHADPEPHAAELLSAARQDLESAGAMLHLARDLYLVEPGSVRTVEGRPYTIFTPFSRRWLEADRPLPVREPAAVPTPGSVLSPDFGSIPLDRPRGLLSAGPPGLLPGGTAAGLRRWEEFRADALGHYAQRRDPPALEGTSRLSPHLRFGTVGVRRIVAEARESWLEAAPAGRRSIETFMKEIAWREFYAAILAVFPRVATSSFRPEFDHFEWETGREKERLLGAWSEGRTGYPIVDAGMRQLRHEGWMHNRVRMIVASFLTKDLLVDWREGERLFRALLADGDLASNNGGWQWAAGSGTDAQPFFRIFNPVSQGERFDPEGAYVRRWVEELTDWKAPVPRALHAPWLASSPPKGYPPALVDHARARQRALDAFAAVRSVRTAPRS